MHLTPSNMTPPPPPSPMPRSQQEMASRWCHRFVCLVLTTDIYVIVKPNNRTSLKLGDRVGEAFSKLLNFLKTTERFLEQLLWLVGSAVVYDQGFESSLHRFLFAVNRTRSCVYSVGNIFFKIGHLQQCKCVKVGATLCQILWVVPIINRCKYF